MRPTDHRRSIDRVGPAFTEIAIGDVDLILDVIGGDIQKESAALVKSGGALVSIVGPVESPPARGRAVDFVVVADRHQ